MSDFTSNFWNLYIAITTVVALVFCAWLLIAVGRDKGKASETTHVWDGDLTELNNQLPNWWRGLFWALLIFSVGYLIYYPGLGSFKGLGNWTQVGQLEKEMIALENQTRPMYDRFLAMSAEDLAKDQKAMVTAERIFQNTCARCHGSDARGFIGYTNLRSGAWSWGGDPADIEYSIAEGRTGIMMPMGDALGGEPGVKAVVAYMRSLSGLDHDASKVAQGETLFEENCVACHGMDAKGMKDIGAPDLTDNVWVHGGTERAMEKVVALGRNSDLADGDFAMPPHKEVLSKGQIHLLTAYVWGLTNK
ncbi:MAG: cytochrome-c oxidase, cbb3-type subunit III [Proteobacteria bacterium]|nr:cytochrome-c oxidase, cbb3-type subunit III [Pseudomonadota bacterium]MCL2307112.1 cytochrome-c oxidase, cbb3-type subunit III [Pseudomonadota bacterium]